MSKLTRNQKEVLALMKRIGSKWVQDQRTKRTYYKLVEFGFLTCEASFKDSGTWYHIKK